MGDRVVYVEGCDCEGPAEGVSTEEYSGGMRVLHIRRIDGVHNAMGNKTPIRTK